MTVTLSQEARARVDEHLDAVERALFSSGASRERRRGVLDDLEAQITEMLERRSSDPTAGDVGAVLAALDPPAAYGTPRSAAPAARKMKKRRFHMRHVIAILLVVCGTAMVMLPSLLDFAGAHYGAHANYMNSVSPSGLTENDIQILHMMGAWTLIGGIVASAIALVVDLVRK